MFEVLGALGALTQMSLFLGAFAKRTEIDFHHTCGTLHQSMHQQRPRRHRAILTEQQAIEIFRIRSQNSTPILMLGATFVAKRYGINERTVRDIWKQRTWTRATCSMAEGASPMLQKKIGRPIGSKDTKPRRQKLAAETSIPFYQSTTVFAASERDARPSIYSIGDTIPRHGSLVNEDPMQGSLDSSDEAGLLDGRSLLEDGREAGEASIDDQLHAWAQRGPHWIIDAALSLDWGKSWGRAVR